MSKEELLLKYWRELPPDHQQSLIHFAEFLHTKARREVFKVDQLLHDRIGVVDFQPDDLSDRTHSAYSEALQLKYNDLKL